MEYLLDFINLQDFLYQINITMSNIFYDTIAFTH